MGGVTNINGIQKNDDGSVETWNAETVPTSDVEAFNRVALALRDNANLDLIDMDRELVARALRHAYRTGSKVSYLRAAQQAYLSADDEGDDFLDTVDREYDRRCR